MGVPYPRVSPIRVFPGPANSPDAERAHAVSCSGSTVFEPLSLRQSLRLVQFDGRLAILDAVSESLLTVHPIMGDAALKESGVLLPADAPPEHRPINICLFSERSMRFSIHSGLNLSSSEYSPASGLCL